MTIVDKEKIQELVNRSATGDKNAYRELFEIYYKRVYNLAFNIMNNREDAEEVLQEAFVKAYLALPNFKGDSSFYTWLYRIVRNMAIDVKRKSFRRVNSDFELDENRFSSEDISTSSYIGQPDKILENKQALSIVQKALANIKEEQRLILVLREIDGFSYEEISKITGLASGTVMSRLFYARKAFNEEVIKLSDDKDLIINNLLIPEKA